MSSEKEKRLKVIMFVLVVIIGTLLLGTGGYMTYIILNLHTWIGFLDIILNILYIILILSLSFLGIMLIGASYILFYDWYMDE